ncbi:uncharacterized protein LOC100185859 [Ciona intestinalis]
MFRLARTANLTWRVSAPRMSRAMSDEGAIRQEGGKLAKKAAADENQYIRQLEAEQMKALRKHHLEEIEEHKQVIERLQSRIKQHEEKLQQIKPPVTK